MELRNKPWQTLKAFIIVNVLSVSVMASSVLAATKWTSPSKPSNVPTDFAAAVSNATNWLLGFVAMLAVLVIVWGGINYIGSAGDEDRARTAKKTITYGLIGVVIAGFAYAIVKVIVVTIL